MKAKVSWLQDAMMLGESGSGHTVVLDGPEGVGGRNIGIRPMEMMLLSVAACSCVDVIGILKKSRQDFHDCVAEVEGQRADAVPAVFEKIHVHFIVSGRELDASKVERAVALSSEKYCSASIMMRNAGVAMTHSVEVKQL